MPALILKRCQITNLLMLVNATHLPLIHGWSVYMERGWWLKYDQGGMVTVKLGIWREERRRSFFAFVFLHDEYTAWHSASPHYKCVVLYVRRVFARVVWLLYTPRSNKTGSHMSDCESIFLYVYTESYLCSNDAKSMCTLNLLCMPVVVWQVTCHV